MTGNVFSAEVDRPEGPEVIGLAMGCFWGAEKMFWETPGVTGTAVGYQGGHTDDPTYESVCSGRTGHAEVVRVSFDPAVVGVDDLLRLFFENHDPTQGMRQGNDIGSQYRSVIFPTTDAQAEAAQRVRDDFAVAFARAGYPPMTTEIVRGAPFHRAEEYHQRYLAKNPHGYCPIHATGVTCG